MDGYLELEIQNGGPARRDNRVHAYPLTIGMTMGIFNHHWAYRMILIGHQTSYSTPRCMIILFNLSETLYDSINFQHENKKQGVRGVSKTQVLFLSSLHIPSRVESLSCP